MGIMAQDVQKYTQTLFMRVQMSLYTYNTFALVPYLNPGHSKN